MFKRLMIDDATAIATLVAFVVAAAIFGFFVWRAIRMTRRQVEEFENLPFKTPTPESGSGFMPDTSTANTHSSGVNPDPQSDESL